MPRSPRADNISIRCGLEKPSCIKADGDGGWEIKLTVPDSESAQMLELSKWRNIELICVFVQAVRT